MWVNQFISWWQTILECSHCQIDTCWFLLQTLTSFRREQHFSVLDCTAQLCPGGETDRSWRESPEPKPNRKFSEPKPKRETTQRFSHGRSTARDGKTCGPIAQTVNQYSNVSQPTKHIWRVQTCLQISKGFPVHLSWGRWGFVCSTLF